MKSASSRTMSGHFPIQSSKFRVQSSEFRVQSLEVVADPEREARLTQPFAAGLAFAPPLKGKDVILPLPVEQRPPGPVEVNREPQRERLQPDAVRGAAVDQL